MKAVHVLESTATGTLSVVTTIANRLAKEGHQVYVIYSIRDDTPSDLSGLFHPGVVLQHIQMKGVSVATTLWRLRRRLNELQPDVVHLHSSFAGFLGRMATLFSLPATSFFYSPHCISFMRADVGKAKRLCFVGLEWLATIRSATYVACSKSEAESIRAYLSRDAVLVENAVDASVFARGTARSQASAETGVKRVVTVGGIRPQKNPRLFATIAGALRNDGVEFVWIGDGDPALKTLLAENGVHVTGWLPRSQVLDEVSRADIYQSTSSWEAMPISVIEAMCLGKPIVATRCAGNIDIVEHGVNGLLYDSEHLAINQLRTLLKDDVLRATLSRGSQRMAEARFHEDRFFNTLTRLYGIRFGTSSNGLAPMTGRAALPDSSD
jgi:glycosyltransferase involved in cell wall biosynthesis